MSKLSFCLVLAACSVGIVAASAALVLFPSGANIPVFSVVILSSLALGLASIARRAD